MMDRRQHFFLWPFFLLFLFMNFLPNPAGGQEEELLKHPRELIFPPLVFNPPQADRHVLSNGLVLYLLEDRELPLINVSALIRTGSVYDPPGESGLAQVTATVLRTGGTEDQPPRAINEALESMAAQLEFSMEREAGRASLSVLQKDFPRALAIFAALLTKPAFNPEQLDLAKRQEMEAIRRSNDHPEEIAYREFRQVLYEGNPHGQVPTLPSIEAIRREDLVAFHQKFFHPNNILLGVSGDFKKEEMIKLLEEAFGDWKHSLIELPFVPLPSFKPRLSIYHVPKDLPQATILLGHLSLPVDHPDYFPFKVLNFILGEAVSIPVSPGRSAPIRASRTAWAVFIRAVSAMGFLESFARRNRLRSTKQSAFFSKLSKG